MEYTKLGNTDIIEISRQEVEKKLCPADRYRFLIEVELGNVHV